MWANSREKPSLKKKPVIDWGLLVWDECDQLAEIPALLVDYHSTISEEIFVKAFYSVTSSL